METPVADTLDMQAYRLIKFSEVTTIKMEPCDIPMWRYNLWLQI